METLLTCAEDILGLPADEMREQLDLDLFENSLIDSLGCVSLISAVEEETGKKIDLSALAPEDLKTLSKIAAAIERVIE